MLLWLRWFRAAKCSTHRGPSVPAGVELGIDRLILGRRYILHGASTPEVVADLAGKAPYPRASTHEARLTYVLGDSLRTAIVEQSNRSGRYSDHLV